ncbi:hypothetical protein [Halorubrum sp. T3]|uniref:hypothetical protein n=1 Tax=Halorubrum sp. T3 TaxID=1194088 RepID=UPI0012BA9A69|nr:hypothetical protein [Halorubrum sp. T3]
MMGLRRLITGHQYNPYLFAFVGGVALALFTLSFFIELRIIIESPSYGDITSIISTIWKTILGLTTIGSFILAAYNYQTETDDSDGPATGFTIQGQNHNIDFHLHVDDTPESSRESEDTESTEDEVTEGEGEESEIRD